MQATDVVYPVAASFPSVIGRVSQKTPRCHICEAKQAGARRPRATELLWRAGDVNPLMSGLAKNQGTNVPRSPQLSLSEFLNRALVAPFDAGGWRLSSGLV